MAFALAGIAALSFIIWLYLVFARGGFWRGAESLDGPPPALGSPPAVAAVVPARDEAELLGGTLPLLLRQDYPEQFAVFLVDDHSSDGTPEAAERAARACGRSERLTIVPARPLPEGWTGKLWAVSEGIRRARKIMPEAAYFLLTDADIQHDAESVRRLVAKAEGENLALVSLMAALSPRRRWERLLIPAFVFFFQKLYPFAWVNDPARRTAAAAGGCVLVRGSALDRAGGLEAIRNELIDDCALARRIKAEGEEGGARIWLGHARSVRSVRPYGGIGGVWRMVARTAYAQLRHSPSLLAGTLGGMILAYLVPPLAALSYPLHQQAAAGGLGLAAWILMAAAFGPSLRRCRQPFALAPLLPVAALFYIGMTLDSARAHRRGRGGAWKGRVWRPPEG